MERSTKLATHDATPAVNGIALSSNIRIRPASLVDLPEIFNIYNHAVLHTTATFQEVPESNTFPLQWFRTHEKNKLPIFIASDQGVVGWASLSPYHPRSGYRFTAETSVYVREDRQGAGIGKALLRTLIEEASILGLHKLVALVDKDNLTSIKLHTSLGFTEAGVLHEVAYKFDKWLDLTILEKTISG